MSERIALVTGANRGIGFATARLLLQHGHRTVLTSRREADGKKAMEKLQEYSDLMHYHPLDVTDLGSIARVAGFVERQWNSLDILINNAGINYDTWQQATNADLDMVPETLDTNLLGPWRMCQAFIPTMQRHGYGRIVNVSSSSGALDSMGGGTPAYGISKAALNALTIKLAAELRGTNILVNAVCPGWVKTDMGGSSAPRSPQKGAETLVWLAELPEGSPSGKFWRDQKQIPF